MINKMSLANLLATAAMTLGGVALSFTLDSYSLLVFSFFALTVVVGAGLNILIGLSGQISFGHIAFYAIGAYVCALLTMAGCPLGLAMIAAALVSGALGALLAIPALRVEGPYLAMITIAFALVVHHGLVEWRGLTGGANGLMGIPMPQLGDMDPAVLMALLASLLMGAFARTDKVDVEAEIEAILRRFPRLRDRIDSPTGLLSGGEQQMVAVGRGLMARPRILLLDEPSLGLSPAMIGELYDALAALRDEGVTLLLVDQMANLALQVADRAYVLETGRIVKSGSAEALRGDRELEAAYLGEGAVA